MPEGSAVARGPVNPFEARFAFSSLGALADELEFLLIIFPFDFSVGEFAVAGGDVAITGLSCLATGECYYGRPHPDLPEMLVISQDVLVTAGDFAVSWTVILDLLTTSTSFVYDTIDIGGGVPNWISIGITRNSGYHPWKVYILVYPDGGTEWNPEGWN